MTTASGIYIIMDGYDRWNTFLVVSDKAVLLAFLSSMLVCVFASILPAIYASRIKITDAIKYA